VGRQCATGTDCPGSSCVTVSNACGDGDGFGDPGERVRIALSLQNNSGIDLTGVTLALATGDPDIQRVRDGVIAIPEFPTGAILDTRTLTPPDDPLQSADGRFFEVVIAAGATSTNPLQPARGNFSLTLFSNEAGGISASTPFQITLDLDLLPGATVTPTPARCDPDLAPAQAGLLCPGGDADCGSVAGACEAGLLYEDFESPGPNPGIPKPTGGLPQNNDFSNTLGFIERNGTTDSDAQVVGKACWGFIEVLGRTAADGCRIDPDFDTDWHFEVSGTVPAPKALHGTRSAHCGRHTTGNRSGDTTALREIEAFDTSPINLTIFPGPADLFLSFWHIVSLADDNAIGFKVGQAGDRADVQISVDQDPGPADNFGRWQKLVPFQNVAEHTTAVFSWWGYCEFTPTDGAKAAGPNVYGETMCFPDMVGELHLRAVRHQRVVQDGCLGRDPLLSNPGDAAPLHSAGAGGPDLDRLHRTSSGSSLLLSRGCLHDSFRGREALRERGREPDRRGRGGPDRPRNLPRSGGSSLGRDAVSRRVDRGCAPSHNAGGCFPPDDGPLFGSHMALSILLVDDAAFMRSMLRGILESEGGHRVVAEASDGTAALSLQPQMKPDLIISDLIMPGMDGIEMTRALVGSDPSIRVIVSGSNDQEGAVLRALSAGAEDFLRKPYSALEVLGTLSEPPPDPEPPEGEERLVRLRIALKPFTPLPAARLRVLSSRCSGMGRIVRVLPAAADRMKGSPSQASLEMLLRTRSSPETIRDYLRGLRGVADVGTELAEPKPDLEARDILPRPVRSLPGLVRVKASLLDRLLDRAEEALAERDGIASLAGSSEIAGPLDPILKRLEASLQEIRAEVLSARMVPFDRTLQRLSRAVAESAASSGRQAALALEGGGSRVDMAVLEEIARILVRLLPRVVAAGVERSDLLRQLGRNECREVAMKVARHGPALSIALRVEEPAEAEPGDLIDPETRERVTLLGGSAGVSRDSRGWKVEMMVPAGVAVVRSYLCQAGKHLYAVPVGSVERAVDLDAARIRVREGQSYWEEDPDQPVPLVRFEGIPWVDADGSSRAGFPGLLYRVGPQRYALALDAVLGETDVVVRPSAGGDESARLTGTALLPDGGVAIVPDLLRLARTR
jgi:two-component system, chemotaxis family, chemotaxis protein CheY